MWVCSQYHKGKGDPQKTHWEVSVDGGSKAELGWIWQREHTVKIAAREISALTSHCRELPKRYMSTGSCVRD